MLNLLAKSALESAVVLDVPYVRSSEQLMFHPFVRKPVAFASLTKAEASELEALGWGNDRSYQPEKLDTLAMLQAAWPELLDVGPETLAPVLNKQGIKLAIEGLPLHLRHRGMVWTKTRCKALGLHSLVSFIDNGMPELVMASDHPLAPSAEHPTVFLMGEDPQKAFLITGDERSGYRLHTFTSGESTVQSRHSDSMEDLFRPEPEWGAEDWASLDSLLTASRVDADVFWSAAPLAAYPNTRNSLLDMLDERYWQAQVQQDGVGALVGVAHDLFQRRFRDSVTTPWLVAVADKFDLKFETPAEFRMMTDAWAISELDDQTVIEEVLPLIREEHDSTLAHWSDERLLALWRTGFDAVIQNVQRMQNTGAGQGIIRNGPIVTNVTPSEVRTVLQEHYSEAVINSLEDAGKIVFLASPHELPETLKSNYSAADLECIAGLEHNGKVYLCADRVGRDQIVGLFLHEVGEHAALNHMLGPDYGRLVTQFERLLQSGDPYARRSAARVPKSTPAFQIHSERLAYLIENVANEQVSMKGGEGGFALGQECIANLRAWVFRAPISRYLDKVGLLDDFQLDGHDVAALAREAVDFYSREFSPELRAQPMSNSWIDLLDHALLDKLYMAPADSRKELLHAMTTKSALGYLYALQSINAPSIGDSVDGWIAIAAETAVTGPDELKALAGQVITNHAKIQTRDRLGQQISRQGFAIWQDDTATKQLNPRHLHMLTKSQKFEGFWQLTTFDHENGPIGDTQHKHWDEALAAVSPSSQYVPDNEALAALQYFSGQAYARDAASEVRAEQGDLGSQPRLSFAGPQALTHNAESLLVARQMEQMGADNEDIRKQTSWFIGVDGKWRYEIDDSKAFIKGTRQFEEVFTNRSLALAAMGQDRKLTVGDVMYHPALFAAYPSIATLEVRLLVSPANEQGHAILGALADDGFSQWIEINTILSANRALSVMSHELQHRIQKIEGFAGGGNIDSLTDLDLTSYRYDDIERGISIILEQHPDVSDAYTRYISLRREAQAQDWTPAISDQVDAALNDLLEHLGGEELFNLTFEKDVVSFNDNTISAREQYRRLAGEVEARLVESRISKTSDERLELSPITSADYAPADQIVVWNTKSLRSTVIEQLTKPKNLEHTRAVWNEASKGYTQYATANGYLDGADAVDLSEANISKAGSDRRGPYLRRQVGYHEDQPRVEALPGVVVPMAFSDAALHVREAREVAAQRQQAWVNELKARLQQLKSSPDSGNALIVSSQRALTDALARLQSLAKLPDPELNSHMSWESPVSQKTAALLFTTLRFNAAGLTGMKIFSELSRELGSPQGAATALADAGVLGAHSATTTVFWDCFTTQLADDLAHLHTQEKLHLAYYGSENPIDRFSMEQVREGDGAHAFGYGLDFTESKLVAGHYQTRHLHNALMYETTRYQNLRDWQDREIPEIVSQYAEDIANPGEFDVQLRRLSFMSSQNSTRLAEALGELPSNQRAIAEHVLGGIMKLPARFITDFHLIPEGGTRTLKKWSEDQFAQQRLGVTLLECALHWKVRPGMSDDALQSALELVIAEKGDIGFWTAHIQALEMKLKTQPLDSESRCKLQDARRSLSEAVAIQAAVAEQSFTVCPPIGMGNVYAVEIDLTSSDYLKWDQPLSQQAASIVEAVHNLANSEILSPACRDELRTCIDGDGKGAEFYKAIAQRKVTMLANDAATEATAARLLLNHGIHGVRYPDNQSAKEGCARFNYVIFDDAAVRIVGESNKPLEDGLGVALLDHGGSDYLNTVPMQKSSNHTSLRH